MTQLHSRNPENRQQIDFRNGTFPKKKHLQPVEWESVTWLTASKDLSGNNAEFVSIDLIGEKNQVILELQFLHFTFVILIIRRFFGKGLVRKPENHTNWVAVYNLI